MLRNRFIALLLLALTAVWTARGDSLVSEEQMQDGLLQMLARFTEYMKNDFQPCQEPNSVGEACGCFRSNNTMKSNEDGVRTNADLGMVCAFLAKYAKGKVALPQGVSWQDVELMARQSLVFAYSTHKANRLKPCADGRYWGSVSQRDHTWESSLWAMSVAFQAAFLWDSLSLAQRDYIHQLLRAECNYELERDIPTGFRGDTKAEENGWEADVLAAALGLFPADELAPRWRQCLLQFAVNAYSHPSDARNTTPVSLLPLSVSGASSPGTPVFSAPVFSAPGSPAASSPGVPVSSLYCGPNLYPDYTLQNHNYFHTSYQNVVIQELGEAALALNLTRSEPIGTGLLWHCREVCDSVLYWLALSDGELAMPNGNDWSLFLYDQLTSYSTMACLLRDPDALMLERRAFEMIRHRQQTTLDGSWLLRSDIGARRMGVEAHRVMMTWLMHHTWPTADLQPSTWDDFRQRYSQARLLPCQQVVRASTPDCFTCFSWSEGLKSYTGYIAPHLTAEGGLQTSDYRLQTTDYGLQTSDYRLQAADFRPEASNLVVPFKAHNTGNLLGWYEVEGRRTNAVPAEEPVFHVEGDVWSVEGHLLCNDSALDLRFTIQSTSGNALIYKDIVRARKNVTILREKGALLAISEDELTSTHRHYSFGPGYVSVDDAFSIVVTPAKKMMVDRPQNNNSVLTALLYASYDDQPRHYRAGEVVDSRSVVYYANVTAAQTARLAAEQAHTPRPAGTPAR